ncbi:putative minor fimbrial subunit StfE [Serratia quinivorans]|nr:putative minor fimbrial subunit StfE [Serratia quinivorans]
MVSDTQCLRLGLVQAGRALGLLILSLGAAQAVEQATVTVKVTIIAPPCEINGNNLIEVNFGNDVMTTRVDGNYKKMPLPYSVECKDAPSTAMKMRIDGTGASFDSQALRTNQTDFGIAFLNGGTRLPINSWLKFTYPNLPSLEAVPVKRSGAKLAGGAFSAGATMKVEYQ